MGADKAKRERQVDSVYVEDVGAGVEAVDDEEGEVDVWSWVSLFSVDSEVVDDFRVKRPAHNPMTALAMMSSMSATRICHALKGKGHRWSAHISFSRPSSLEPKSLTHNFFLLCFLNNISLSTVLLPRGPFSYPLPEPPRP